MAIQILMPALSPTMTDGKLAKWLKKEGDAVVSGDVIAEIETDKATMEMEAVDEGTIGKILVPEGSEGVAVNAPIAVLLEEGEDASAIEAASSPAKAPAPAPAAEKPAAPAPEKPAAPQSAAAPAGDRVFASPLARRMAEQAGLSLADVQGSGPQGRIVKADVEKALAGGRPTAAPAASQAAAAPAPAAPQITAPYTEVPNSSMRKVIAKRLSESKQTIPHFYLTVDCEIDGLLALRKQLNAKSPEGEGAYKLSVNDFVVRAVALALRQVPAANATWTDQAVLRYDEVDVSVAVATPNGLITPVVRKADTKGLVQISREMKDLGQRARDGKLVPEDYQGGGFTISNMGMLGIKSFSAIINPPQSCILAVGAGEQRPVVKDGALAVATVMTTTLSVDHRSVDGAIGAEFMVAFKRMIDDPLTMLL
ncbi:MAG: pyruvate dehydrogenase complex dihydrolipoamide acetyltransferase [Rhodospirillales bacterium]|nr:pyruvate dehydrogenase complex dihydrolipoamide acetyltransferase [Rhodospirillales bacterium]